MKLLLISPPFTGFGGMDGQGGKQAPLNICYIAAEVRKNHPQVELRLLDGENLRVSHDDVEKEVRDFQPDIVGMTFPTPAYLTVKECAARVKKVGRQIQVVVGGPHPSAFPAEILDEMSDIDLCFSGESEKSFSEYIGKCLHGGAITDIQGLTYRDAAGKGHRNPNHELIEDLDTLDFPARDLLPHIKYYSHAVKRVSTRNCGNMITSRGCPYDCTYCESKVIWTRKARVRSPMNVVNEIEEMVTKYGIGEINFHDDIFPMRRDRTIEICQMIQQRKLDVRWICMSRVNFVWDDVMAEMHKAGCRRIMFGLESGSNTILKNIKKNATVERAYEAVQICKKAGIETMGSFMVGNIGETEDTIRETIDFAKKLDLDTASFFVAIPYPGTELYSQAVALGYLPPKVNWQDFCVVGERSGPLNLPTMSNERLRYWQAKALQEFYIRPKFVWKRLQGIRSLKDVGILLYGARTLVSMSAAGRKSGKSPFQKTGLQTS